MTLVTRFPVLLLAVAAAAVVIVIVAGQTQRGVSRKLAKIVQVSIAKAARTQHLPSPYPSLSLFLSTHALKMSLFILFLFSMCLPISSFLCLSVSWPLAIL